MSQRIIITGGSGFIGTNLIEHYLRAGWEVLNIDQSPPRNPEHRAYWRETDLLDRPRLRESFRDFQPSLVLHMGARTDLGGKTLDDYSANIVGVQNVIDAVHEAGTVRRAVYASTRYVFTHGVVPGHDYDYSPHTVYGQSKVKTEEIVRSQPQGCVPWVIIRPTSIWGPWFGTPYKDFFLTVAGNRYLHPGTLKLPKTYGYVGNVVHEIVRFGEETCLEVLARPLFVADYEPLDVLEWAELIQREVGSRPIRHVPNGLLKLIAKAGDAAKTLGMKSPPLTSFRLQNLITPLVYDMSVVAHIVGPLPFTLEQGVKETVRWLKTTGQIN